MDQLDCNWLLKKHGIHVDPELPLHDYTDEQWALRDKLQARIESGDFLAIKPFRKAASEHPKAVVFQHLLVMALFQNDPDDEEARALIRQTAKDFPNNPASIANVFQTAQNEREAYKARDFLGKTLQITDFPAVRDGRYRPLDFQFHERAVIHYLILTGDTEAAAERLDRLLRFGIEEEQISDLRRQLRQAVLPDLSKVEAKLGNLIRTHSELKGSGLSGSGNVVLTGQPRPPLNHPELDLLYDTGWDKMSQKVVNELLALPRTTLIADLRAILRDGLESYADRAEEEEIDWDTVCFPLHAIRLLGGLGATEALPDVLDYFRLEEAAYDFYLGELGEDLNTALYALGKDQLPLLFDYLKQPHNFWYARVVPDSVPALVALHHPERRTEVLAAYTDLVDTFLAPDVADGVADPEQISSMVADWIIIGGGQYRPLIERLYAAGMVSEFTVGPLKSALEDLVEPPRAYDFVFLPETPYEFFLSNYHLRKIREEKEPKKPAAKAASKPKKAFVPRVARNAKCPCGSGRKYKNCCA